MNDLLYYVLFTSISHSIVNLVEIGSFRLVFVIQRTFLSIKRQWNKFQNNQDTSQPRVLELHTKLPASYLPPEGISCEYCECLLMLSWSILFSSALPIVSIVLTIVFIARCRLLLHYMLVLRSNLQPHNLNTSSHWVMILKIVIATSVFTNATILAFVSKNADYRKNSLLFSNDLQASALCFLQRLPCHVCFFCHDDARFTVLLCLSLIFSLPATHSGKFLLASSFSF